MSYRLYADGYNVATGTLEVVELEKELRDQERRAYYITKMREAHPKTIAFLEDHPEGKPEDGYTYEQVYQYYLPEEPEPCEIREYNIPAGISVEVITALQHVLSVAFHRYSDLESTSDMELDEQVLKLYHVMRETL